MDKNKSRPDVWVTVGQRFARRIYFSGNPRDIQREKSSDEGRSEGSTGTRFLTKSHVPSSMPVDEYEL